MTFRLTTKRKRILETLQTHAGVLSARALHTQLPDIDLATIYRNLDLFVQEKLIKPMYFAGDETLYEYQHEPHHHAICNNCERVIHFTAPDKKITKLLELDEFAVNEIEVTVRGSCKNRHAHQSA